MTNDEYLALIRETDPEAYVEVQNGFEVIITKSVPEGKVAFLDPKYIHVWDARQVMNDAWKSSELEDVVPVAVGAKEEFEAAQERFRQSFKNGTFWLTPPTPMIMSKRQYDKYQEIKESKREKYE